MTPIASLWLPIVVSAVIVFVVSSIIHMAMPWHKSDYPRLPDEDGVMAALRPFRLQPGDYVAPRPMSRDMKDPDYVAKRDAGPVFMMTVIPSGPANMGKMMGIWMIYLVVVSAIAGCVAAAALHPGADSRSVFHYVAAVAFACYSMALWQQSIWFWRKWSTTFKLAFDGAIYAAITGGVFVWMWPKA